MTDEDLKQIRHVIKEELASVKATLDSQTKILAVHTKVLDNHSKTLDRHTKKLDALWDQVADLTESMEEVKVTVKSHAVDLDHTKKRVTVIEDHLGL